MYVKFYMYIMYVFIYGDHQGTTLQLELLLCHFVLTYCVFIIANKLKRFNFYLKRLLQMFNAHMLLIY